MTLTEVPAHVSLSKTLAQMLLGGEDVKSKNLGTPLNDVPRFHIVPGAGLEPARPLIGH